MLSALLGSVANSRQAASSGVKVTIWSCLFLVFPLSFTRFSKLLLPKEVSWMGSITIPEALVRNADSQVPHRASQSNVHFNLIPK